MNCPNCGAAIKEGKFCNYCGAKLPDDTQHIEVNGTIKHDHTFNFHSDRINRTKIAKMEKQVELERIRAEDAQRKREADAKWIKTLVGFFGAMFLICILMALLSRH